MLLDLEFDVSTANLAPADVPAEAYHRIAQFLYREARLLDERRYDDWQSLWTDDGMYWICLLYTSDAADDSWFV